MNEYLKGTLDGIFSFSYLQGTQCAKHTESGTKQCGIKEFKPRPLYARLNGPSGATDSTARGRVN